MTRIRVLAVVLGAALALAACGTEHLGSGVGTAFRAAFKAQTGKKESDRALVLDSSDAKRILARYYGKSEDESSGGSSGALSAAPSSPSSSEGSGSGSLESNGPIRLEAH